MINKDTIDIERKSRIVQRAISYYGVRFLQYLRMRHYTSVLTNKFQSDNLPIISLISDSLVNLRNLGVKFTISEEKKIFEVANSKIDFKKPDSIFSVYAILELFHQSRMYGYDIVSSLEQHSLKKYFTISDNVLETYSGIRFHLESIDPYVLTETFILKIHYCFPIADKTILDIGAAFGDTSLHFASEGAEVIAVEPVNFNHLVSNIELNPSLSNKIIPLKVSAGKTGILEVPVEQGYNFDGNAGIKRKGTVRMQVPSKSLMEIIKEAGLESVDILKSDCKGCENEFTITDFGLIKNFFEIECSSNISTIATKLQKAGFQVSLRHYDPAYAKPLNVGGTIIGIKGDVFG
jgi:FkbM family methyltransferase